MIRIGIAGIGFMGMVHYLSYQKLRGAQVVAICDRVSRRRDGDWRDIKGNFGPAGQLMDLTDVRAYAEVDDLLADDAVDLVDITLPPALHADTAIRAVEAGRHVFCEKPMAMTVDACDRMVDAARLATRRLLIGHVLPFFPEYAWALREIRSGKHGHLLGGHFRRLITDPSWLPNYWDAGQVGGPLLDLHVHDAHFIRLVYGMPNAVLTRGTERNGMPEHWHSEFEFSDRGLTVAATSGVISPAGRPFLHAFDIRLEKATLVFEFGVMKNAAGVEEGRYLCPPALLDQRGNARRVEVGDSDPMHAFAAELEHVLEVLEGRTEPGPLAAELARDAVAICHMQSDSLRRSHPRSKIV